MSQISVRLLALLAVLAPAAAYAVGGPARVAVLAEPSTVSVAGAVSSAALDAVRRTGAELVAPEEVAAAVAAAGGDVTTCGSTPACAARVCAALGASVLLVTGVKESGRFWLVSVWLREAKGGWMKGQAVEAVVREERAARDSAAKLVARVLGPYVSGAPPVAATAPPRPPPTAIPLPPPPVAAPTPPRHPAASAAAEPAATTAVAPLELRAPTSSRTAETPGERLAERLAAPAPPARAGASSAANRWGTLLLAGGGVLISGGAIAGVAAWSASNDASLALARGDLGTWAVRRQYSRALTVTAAGVGGAGAVALVAGAWLRLGARASPVALEVAPRAVRFSLAF